MPSEIQVFVLGPELQVNKKLSDAFRQRYCNKHITIHVSKTDITKPEDIEIGAIVNATLFHYGSSYNEIKCKVASAQESDEVEGNDTTNNTQAYEIITLFFELYRYFLSVNLHLG